MGATVILTAAWLVLVSPVPIDGDTLKADNVVVRLFGVDAPEKGEPGAAEATEALRTLVKGETLVCLPKGVSWGRVVALCRRLRDGLDIAMELRCRGLVVDVPSFDVTGRYAQPRCVLP